MLVPRGSPWSGNSAYVPVIMGRALAWFNMPFPSVWLTHLAVAEVYGLVIARFVRNVNRGRAILTGLLIGILFYLLNLGVTSVIWPGLRGNEGAVLFNPPSLG